VKLRDHRAGWSASAGPVNTQSVLWNRVQGVERNAASFFQRLGRQSEDRVVFPTLVLPEEAVCDVKCRATDCYNAEGSGLDS
jgi:hypothetical protein